MTSKAEFANITTGIEQASLSKRSLLALVGSAPLMAIAGDVFAAEAEIASAHSPSPEYIELRALYARWMSIDSDLHREEESTRARNAYYAALARFAGTPHSPRKVAELLSIAVMECREKLHGWDIINGEKAIFALLDAVSELESAGHGLFA